jgi:hypothetical protein
MKGALASTLDQNAKHRDSASFETAVKRCIPSDFMLLASQDEVSQAQEDHYAMDHDKLPPLSIQHNIPTTLTSLDL